MKKKDKNMEFESLSLEKIHILGVGSKMYLGISPFKVNSP